ncbi:putative metal-dependent hydrolase of the TIM-barrel fold protein [Variovorax sp. SRS16]|uniref:amidohydrolase family protein n=1 Tax=Variovorax sp. SRS16 TaxID=282217 RepID=UPI001315E76B|nr:amidohydrolase family protein [Variovorax sp. SRS16]VTU15078.1 putative metal-dependent hydrolase of the TIM-barrel fold protein [Variovorax sp. SRS16]
MTGSTTNPTLPPGACDCHTHVFLDEHEFPLSPSRRYTPPPASIDALSRLHAGLGIERVVIVQPSVYGLDNAATLHALRVLGKGRARGVAVIDAEVPEATLDEMTAAGVRGVRVNLEIDRESDSARSAEQMRRIAARVAPRGWHVQIYASMPLIAACSAVIRELPVPVVLDHYAGAHASRGMDQEGIGAVLDLVAAGKAYVKLSAPYRCSARADHADLESLARRFIQAHPDRMLWGSDWPHPQPGAKPLATDVCPPFVVDTGHALRQLRRWSPDETTLHRILVDNPERLYGFGA